MSELQFAKQYLTTLDAKATKFQPDHVFDPKTFQMRIPYTLPKFPHPPYPEPPKSSSSTSQAPPGSAPAAADSAPTQPAISLTLKSTRNPNLTLHLPNLTATTPINTIKTAIQTALGGPSAFSDPSKIKILHNKKPIPSSKPTLGDAFAGTETEGQQNVTLSVMVMGGAADPATPEQTMNLADDAAAAASGPGSEKAATEAAASSAATGSPETDAEKELGDPKFWGDLEAFLSQRLKSAEQAKRLRGTFEKAYSSTTARP